MGRILFVTVGTSAITNRELWEGRGSADVESDDTAHLGEGERWGTTIHDAELHWIEQLERNGEVHWPDVEKAVLKDLPGFEEGLFEQHKKFWDHPGLLRDATTWKQTSAESISTWLAGDRNLLEGGRLQADRDKVVLVSSMTCVGMMAARINEKIFREFVFHPVDRRKPEVIIETIPELTINGIEARDEDAGLDKRVVKIVDRYIHGHARDSVPAFNITGGYKGLIPAVSHVCSVNHPNTAIIYVHENMKTALVQRYPGASEKIVRLATTPEPPRLTPSRSVYAPIN